MKTIMKYLFSLFLFVAVGLPVVGQEDKGFKEPPRQENTYLFEVLKYDRQPEPPKYMHNRILQIMENPVPNWTAQDSLFYAYESVYLEKFELALSIFTRLNTDTIQDPFGQALYRTALHKLNRYELLEEYNKKTLPKKPEEIYSIRDAYMDLNKAYIAYEKKAFIPDSTLIFPILKDPALREMKRNRSPHKNRLVAISFAIDSAFRQFTILHDDKDYILSQAFEEMGDFQREYFYLTNAYFYYSASRHYFKNDKAVVEKYNQVIDEMNSKNYLFISFKNRFGKVIKNRYRFGDEFIQEAAEDTTQVRKHTPPPKVKVQKDYLPWIDNSILIMIILGLALVFVVFFMKVKK